MTLSEIPYDPSLKLDDLEREWTIKALTHFNNNKVKTAQALGITVKTMYNRLHTWGLSDQYSHYETRRARFQPQPTNMELPNGEP